jgi:hypothetical protein
MAPHNNYFRVHGTTECFTFHDSDPGSLAIALAEATSRASYHRGARTPPVLVWRRVSHPEASSLSVIGEITRPSPA